MSEYTKLTASLKATTINVVLLNGKLLNSEELNAEKLNSELLNAKNIIVETGYNLLSDIVSYIKEKDNEVSSKFVESTYTVENDGGISGNVVLFVLPCDAYPLNVPFSRMTIPVTSGVPQMETGGETTPVYLGVILWNADGTKEIYGISDNQVTCNKFSTATWNFDTKPIVFTNDYRLIFYFIANKEDFTTTEPTVYKDKIKITTRLHKTLDDIDPYYNWNQALTDLKLGWICNDSFSLNVSYPGWPVCTFTTSKLTEIFLTFPNILSTVDTHTSLIELLSAKTPLHTYYQYIDYCEKSNNTGECSAVRLHANLLPHGKNIKAVRLTVANTVTTETWLVAYLVDEDGNFTSIGKSINSNTWSTGDLVEWEFENTFQIPEGSYLQLYIADANSTVSSNNVTRPSYKISLYIANHSGDNQDSVRYDGAWYDLRRIYVLFKEELTLELSQYIDDKFNELDSNSSKLESNLEQIQGQVNTNTELIAYLDQKVTDNLDSMLDQINGLDQGVGELVNQASGRINDLEQQNLVLTNTLGELIHTIDKSNTAKFSNSDGYELDKATIKGFRLSAAHFIKDKSVTSIDIPYTYRDGESPANAYLYVELYNSQNECILRLYSIDPASQTSDKSVLHYEFASLVIPEVYQYALFALVPLDIKATLDQESSFPDIVQGTNCTAFRARPLKSSGSVDFDGDDCLCFDTNQNQLNWIVSIQGAYIIGFKLTSAADYSFRVTPVYTEAGDMDYFNVSSGNVYIENKQIVLIPTKTELRMNSDMGTSLYVLLTVSNKADGSISYSYKAVNESEMEVLGYLFVTPVEEDLSIDTAYYGENNVASTLSIEDPGMTMTTNLDEGDTGNMLEIEPILTNL